jgi:hypothetical protein
MEQPFLQTIAAQAAPPEFVRLPSRGREHHTGLSRSFLNGLILPCEANGNRPPVRSICLRKPGRARGVRLIHLKSLLDWIGSQEMGSAGKDAA